ncbi:MAG: hypothetical protein KF859_07270 [Phycisphaeraceae bacterium]|nr:hypothetical protein [Phycisphaeraceae bacterium]
MAATGQTRWVWRADAGSVAAVCVALAAAGLVIGPVAAGVLGSAWGGVEDWSGVWPAGLMVSTLAWSGVIGVSAGVLGSALAWGLRGRAWLLLVLVLVSLMTPGYLAFSALNMLRDPTTWTGDLLVRAARGPDRWMIVGVGRGLAALGLTLWAWPLAAACAWGGVSRVGRGVEEQLLMDCPTWRSRAGALAGMLVRPVCAAAGMVWLLMLGSAVPLHIAEAPTLAMTTWTELALNPGGGRAWVVAMPLVAAALAGGVLLSRAALGGGGWEEGEERASVGGARRAGVWALVVGAVVCGVPVAAHWWSLDDAGALGRMWVAAGPHAAASAGVGGVVAVAGMALVVCVWRGLSGGAGGGWARRVVCAAGVVFLVGMLMPGVLIGAAHAQAWRWVDEVMGGVGVSDGAAPLVGAHLARFGGVGVVIGAWLARTEDAGTMELSRLDGVGGVRGWAGLVLVPRVGVVLGAGLMIGVLSVHEIESAVVVRPVGLASLSHLLLGYLHFTRREELSAAAVLLAVCGGVMALVVSGLLWSAAGVASRRRRG